MSFFKQLKVLFGKQNQPQVRSDLGFLLSSLQDQETLHEKLDWLGRLLSWIRYEGNQDSHMEKETGKLPSARIRFLLMVLDRHPEWKREVAKLLRAIIHHISAMEFFTETGISKENGFFSEVMDRGMQKILPRTALDKDLASLFTALFPHPKDALWIQSIDVQTFDRLVELFQFESQNEEEVWKRLVRDVEDALTYLVIQVRASGLEPKILRRLDHANFRESPFFSLVRAMEIFLEAYHQSDLERFRSETENFKRHIDACQNEVMGVHKHLDEYGVSVNIVYQLARIESFLIRIESLADCLVREKLDHRQVIKFIAALVRDNQRTRSIKQLVRENISLLARKVVERSAETGEHYITRTKSEYRHMLQAAAGGGMMTALTVYLKVFVAGLHTTLFLEGALHTLNFAASFIFMQLVGFTLATKQPAMTGPALAAKMKDVSSKEGMDALVREIVLLIRSQTAAVFGNVFAVIPTVLLIDTIIFYSFGAHLMSPAKASASYQSMDIFGPVILYASFTGVLLWISSLIAGWADNWFALRGLRRTLAQNPKMIQAFGKRNARQTAIFLEDNISGLAGNGSLGFLLGMIPQIFIFIGIPLGVAHVTLSSGTLAAALPVMGWQMVEEPLFWRAVLGVVAAGTLNISVSFALALWVAMRAKEVSSYQRRAIYKAVIEKFRRSPWTFFFPIGKLAAPATAPVQSPPAAPHDDRSASN